MTVLSTLVIDLKGNSAHFQSELKKANAKSKGFAKKVRANSSAVVKSLGAIGTMGAVALGAIYAKSAANIDVLAKQADKLGVTTQALAGLQHAADLTGVSSKALNKGLLDMTVKVQDAAKGTGEAKDALKELNLNAQVLAKMSPDQQFKKIAEAMKGVEHHGNKVAIAYDLFGAKGTDLINTLAMGEVALNKTSKEAEILGLSLNRVDAAKVEAANDAMTKSSAVFTGIGNAITVGLSPYVKALSDEFYNSALEVGGFGEFTTKALNVVVQSVGYTANVIHGLKAVWIGVKLAAAASLTGIIELLELADSAFTDFVNKMPGMEAQTSGFIGGMADAMRAEMTGLQSELAAFAQKPLPHDGIVEWAAEVQRQTQASALEIAQNTPAALPSPEVQNQTQEAEEPANLYLTDEKVEEQKGYWDQLSEHMAETTENFDTMWGDSFDRFAQGVGDATASAIMEGKSFSDTMKVFAKSMIKQVISGLVQIGVKKVALALIEKGINKAATASAAGVMAANATATSTQAGLAAFASTAAIPMVGAMAAPAAMAAALAITAPMAGAVAATSGVMVGMAHDGIDEIPREGTWLLDKGERVVDSRTNQDLKSALGNGRFGGGDSITIQTDVTIQGNADENVIASIIEQNSEAVYSAMSQAKADRGEEV